MVKYEPQGGKFVRYAICYITYVFRRYRTQNRKLKLKFRAKLFCNCSLRFVKNGLIGSLKYLGKKFKKQKNQKAENMKHETN